MSADSDKISVKVLKLLNETIKTMRMSDSVGFEDEVRDFSTKLRDERGIKSDQERLDELRQFQEELDHLDSLEAQGNLPEEINGVPVPDKETRIQLRDSYNNEALLIGNRSDVWASFDTYSIFDNLHNWQLWLALYMSSWVFRKIIDQQGADVATHGVKITFPSEYKETIVMKNVDGKMRRYKKKEPIVSSDQISDIYENYSLVEPDLVTLASWGKLFGGAIACMLISEESPSEYHKPLGEVKGNIRLYVVDRWHGVIQSHEKVSDIASPDFGTPKYYDVTLEDGSNCRFHHSRVLRYSNKPAPKIISDVLMGWGIPEGLHLFQELNRDEKMKNMITSLLNKYNLEVIKMSGMRAFMTGTLSPQSEAQLDARLEMINRYRSFNSLVFLDTDDEYIREDGSSMSGLADLLEKNKSLVAGAASMPMVLLYGDQQKGLSGNSLDDMELYDQKILAEKNGQWKIAIHKLLIAIAKSKGVKGVEGLKFTFNSIIPITQKDLIDNSNAILSVYQTLKSMQLYDNEMIVRELRSFGDNVIFGSELDDENLEEIIEEEEERKAKEEAEENSGEIEGGVVTPPPGLDVPEPPADMPSDEELNEELGGSGDE